MIELSKIEPTYRIEPHVPYLIKSLLVVENKIVYRQD